MSKEEDLCLKTTDFVAGDPTDGRCLGDWRTKYPPEARKKIIFEAMFLILHLIAGLILIFITPIISESIVKTLDIRSNYPFHSLSSVYALVGGLLGGTLFDIKTLYHSVARNCWNEDRRLWRLFVPYISGALSLIVIIAMQSGIISAFDKNSICKPENSLSISFIVGYFSDNAIAKLREIANTLLGPNR